MNSIRELEPFGKKALYDKIQTLYKDIAEYETQELEATDPIERRKAQRQLEKLGKQLERNEHRYRNMDLLTTQQREFHPIYYGGEAGKIETLSWSPDGRYLASGSSDGMVRIWEVKTSRTIFEKEKHRGGIQELSWSPDGEYIASANVHTLIWHWRTGKNEYACRHGPPVVKALDWSPDGQTLALARSKSVEIWQRCERSYKKALTYTNHGHIQLIEAVAWSPDGTFIASCNSSQVHVWTLTPSLKTLYTYNYDFGRITTLAWDQASKRLLLGRQTYASAFVEIWSPSDKHAPQTIGSHHGHISAIAVSPNHEMFASGSFDGTIKIWDAKTLKELFAFDNLIEDTPGHVHAVIWSPDNKSLAVAIDYMVYILPASSINSR